MRLTREQFKLELVTLLGKRGTCKRAQVGAAIFRGDRIISTGYVGGLPGETHCLDADCSIELRQMLGTGTLPTEHCVRTVHAEMNAIVFAAKHGISLHGSEMWVSHTPCYQCARAIIQVGIKQIHWSLDYGDVGFTYRFFKVHGVEVI